MRFVAQEWLAWSPPGNVMRFLAVEEAALERRLATAGRNGLCPCGNGRKVKRCQGHAEPAT